MEFDKPKVPPGMVPEIVAAFDAGNVLEIEYLGGVPNVTYRVLTNNQHLAVRISNHGYTSPDHLKSELDILQHLQSIGFEKSPCLIPGINGNYLQGWMGYPVCATKYIAGLPGDKVDITPQLCYEVGYYVAKMQIALSFYRGSTPKSESLSERGMLMMKYFHRRAKKVGWKIDFDTIVKQWMKADKLLLSHRKELPEQIIHSDVWPPNIICAENKINGIVDFDDWCFGPAIMDVCAPLIEFPMYYTKNFNEELAFQLLKGYIKAKGKISRPEQELIITGMEVGCAMWLACNALHEVSFEESETYVYKLALFADQTSRMKFYKKINEIINAASSEIGND